MSVLSSPQSLPMNIPITSPNGKYALVLRESGCLVGLTAGEEGNFWTQFPTSPGPGPYRLAMQANGNLVVYDATDSPVWAAWEHRLNEPGRYELVMQDDRNIVVQHPYVPGRVAIIWESGTAVRGGRRPPIVRTATGEMTMAEATAKLIRMTEEKEEEKKLHPSDRSRSVFVGNIPYDATEEQLIEIFREVGPVVSFRLVHDKDTGKPKGYGFCEYGGPHNAASAMRNLNGREFNGKALRVDHPVQDRMPSIGRILPGDYALGEPIALTPAEIERMPPRERRMVVEIKRERAAAAPFIHPADLAALASLQPPGIGPVTAEMLTRLGIGGGGAPNPPPPHRTLNLPPEQMALLDQVMRTFPRRH